MIPLVMRSYYSPLMGVHSPEELVNHALERKQKTLVLSDINSVCGVVHFVNLCRDNGIKPIIGAEIGPESRSRAFSFVYLCRSEFGYKGLCHLITMVKDSKILDISKILKILEEFNGHYVVLSQDTAFLDMAKNYEHVFYLLSPHLIELKKTRWCRENMIPMVASPRVHALYEDDFRTLELAFAIKKNETIEGIKQGEVFEDFKSWHHPNCYWASEDFLEKKLSPYEEAVKNNILIGELCSSDWFGRKTIFPRYQNLKENEAFDFLKKISYEKISKRYGALIQKDATLESRIHKRIEKELRIIKIKGYSSYFLTVADIVSQSIHHCGRGSAAASIICYLLEVTHVDPIEHNLFFERFLNEDRVDMPDIDIDFPWDERDHLLDFVFEKYRGRAAMVANHNFLRGKNALRQIAKVHGIPSDEITYFSDRYPRIKVSEKWEKVLEDAQRVEGLFYHLSVHPGGVVITPDSIENHVPIETSPKGLPIIQWEKDQAEEGGLVKIDFLGNRSLAVVRDTLNNIKKTQDVHISYADFNPIEDEKTKELMIQGKTMGCFYVESPGTRLYLQKQRSGEFEHNVIAGSVIRPAARPFANIIARRIRGEPFRHLHPLLKPVLEETYGVMIYQEQVTQVAMALSDFTAGEGNELRKVLTKKHKAKVLAHYKDKFFRNALTKGIRKSILDDLWSMILSFAGYSFCKPHSASYCLVSYKSAYLKVHYPAEFMAAVISNRGGYYSTQAYLEEVRRMGIKILPPDVSYSAYDFVGFTNFIRVGLSQIKHLKIKTLFRIIKEREKLPFRSLKDFLIRVHPSLPDAKVLNMSRALSSLESVNGEKGNLTVNMWEIYYHFRNDVKNYGLDDLSDSKLSIPKLKRTSLYKAMMWELEVLQGAITFPAWALYQKYLNLDGRVRGSEFSLYKDQKILVFGIKVTEKGARTKYRESMSFVSFDDDVSGFDTVFFPQQYATYQDLLFLGGAYLLEGVVREDEGTFVLEVHHCKRLEIDIESLSPKPEVTSNYVRTIYS